jgi:hypothetical protein
MQQADASLRTFAFTNSHLCIQAAGPVHRIFGSVCRQGCSSECCFRWRVGLVGLIVWWKPLDAVGASGDPIWMCRGCTEGNGVGCDREFECVLASARNRNLHCFASSCLLLVSLWVRVHCSRLVALQARQLCQLYVPSHSCAISTCALSLMRHQHFPL